MTTQLKITEAGKFLEQLCGSTPIDTLDALISRFDVAPKTIDEFKAEEALLRTADSTKERRHLVRQAEKLDALHDHIERLHSVLGDDGMEKLQESHDHLETVQKAADLLAQSFRSQPLPGVGSSPWRVLWESARRFSEEQAYVQESDFPLWDTRADASCASRGSNQKDASGCLDSRCLSRTTRKQGLTKFVDPTTHESRNCQCLLFRLTPW